VHNEGIVLQEGDKMPRGSIKLELKKFKLFNLQAQLRSQVHTLQSENASAVNLW
jgi:hypothetical protein